MADDMTRALAFVARRQGSRLLPAATWWHVMSLELAWMPPSAAKAFVERAVAAGILMEDGDALRFGQDPSAVEIPRGFRPDPDATAEVRSASSDPFVTWAQKVAKARGQGLDDVLASVAARQDEAGGLWTADVAVLSLAREAGLDVRGAAAEALERLMQGASKGRAQSSTPSS